MAQASVREAEWARAHPGEEHRKCKGPEAEAWGRWGRGRRCHRSRVSDKGDKEGRRAQRASSRGAGQQRDFSFYSKLLKSFLKYSAAFQNSSFPEIEFTCPKAQILSSGHFRVV